MSAHATQRGFSLIELMIAVAIVAIISSIAVPSYTRYIVDARVARAQADLVNLAAAMERHRQATFSYRGAAGPDASNPADDGAPWIFNAWSPSDEPEANKHYDLTIASSATRSYSLQATPVTGSPQAAEGSFTYDSTGRKSW